MPSDDLPYHDALHSTDRNPNDSTDWHNHLSPSSRLRRIRKLPVANCLPMRTVNKLRVRFALVLLSVLATFGSAPCHAASIKATPVAAVQDTAFVVVSGELQAADAEQFRSAVAVYPKAIVAFESTGGSLL